MKEREKIKLKEREKGKRKTIRGILKNEAGQRRKKKQRTKKKPKRDAWGH